MKLEVTENEFYYITRALDYAADEDEESAVLVLEDEGSEPGDSGDLGIFDVSSLFQKLAQDQRALIQKLCGQSDGQ